MDSKSPSLIPANDSILVKWWLRQFRQSTRERYRYDIKLLKSFCKKSIKEIAVGDLQRFAASLKSESPRTQARRLSAVRSLFRFSCDVGYIAFNPAHRVRFPDIKNDLAERILGVNDIKQMIHYETDHRNKAIIMILYFGGIRVSELCGLKWRDLTPIEFPSHPDIVGQLSVFGKRGKTRFIGIPLFVWDSLLKLRGKSSLDDPVFRSRKGGHLSRSQILRIVKNAAENAGVERNTMPHALRHSHASHSLAQGADIRLVQATLGHSTLTSTVRYLHVARGDSSARFLKDLEELG